MISAELAKRIVQNNLCNNMTISKREENSSYFIFHCKNICRNAIPNKIICVLNKENGNIGFSTISVDDAIQNQKK